MDSVFNEIFSHIIDQDVAELTSLPDFIHLTQRDNPVSNTPEFLKLILTLEVAVKKSSYLIRVSNIDEKFAREKLEEDRRNLFGGSSDEEDSVASGISSGLMEGLAEDDEEPSPWMKMDDTDASGSSRTDSVFFKDNLGETTEERLNKVFMDFLVNSGTTSVIASLLNDNFTVVQKEKRGSYVVYYNPLDSAYNVYFGSSCGSFFCFASMPWLEVDGKIDLEETLISGDYIDCAGYVIYGCSTILTLAIRNSGVHQFTLDNNLGLFILSARNIKTPLKGKTYTICEPLSLGWNPVIALYIENRKKSEETFDYYQPGSIVSALHYILKEGGIYIDPALITNESGKTHLLFTAIPMAFIMEQSGGYCFNGGGLQSILELQPQTLHQTTTICLGSKTDIMGLWALFHDYTKGLIH